MKILVPTAGFPPAKQSADYIVRIANNLSADLVVLHVYSGTNPEPNAKAAFDVFVETANKAGINVQSRVQRGNIVDSIISVAESGEYALIIMGASAGIGLEEWISSQVLHSSHLPVVVIPHAFPTKGKTK
ncbi:MAG: hypothetical protein CVT49_13005 [candidate division Zixibacteria bacterium HGW-Zixibacteria-1]|nr:MAG: hypothetical protein CVT49_13005 [candidate division Zixibacteria bacterium HGW-Zixibacteria-1]